MTKGAPVAFLTYIGKNQRGVWIDNGAGGEMFAPHGVPVEVPDPVADLYAGQTVFTVEYTSTTTDDTAEPAEED